jgi:hypothetical protein
LPGRPSAVSTSLLSTAGVDVDLHLVLARSLRDVLTAITFVRVSFREEQIAVDLCVSRHQVASDAAASELVAAQALALRRNPAACREFVRRATAAVTIFCPN